MQSCFVCKTPGKLKEYLYRDYDVNDGYTGDPIWP